MKLVKEMRNFRCVIDGKDVGLVTDVRLPAVQRGALAQFTDDDIVRAVDRGDYAGGRVYNILRRLTHGMGNDSDLPALRRRLLKLEAAGRVYRCPRLSAINSTYWWPGRDLADKSYEALRR